MNYKHYTIKLSLIFLILLTACLSDSKQNEPSKPNIILIIADDVNWDDVGAYGNTKIKTPQIDRLANDGMKFTSAFLTISSCSPSRTSIISGLYPHNTDAEQLAWPLPENKKTFVNELKKSGYWTGLAGKYHLGDPVRDDFDMLLEMKWKDSIKGIDRKLVGDGSGSDDWISLLKKRPKDKPFFLWLASADAHRPFYEGISENPYKGEDTVIPPYIPDTKEVRKDFALYYDEISRFDTYVGKIVAELEAQKISKNTMIILISDNGRAFPREKTTLYEGGIKTPFIVKWPSKVKANTVNDNLISSIDIAPTIMQAAGIKPLKEFEGYNFLPMLESNKHQIRDQIYAEDSFHDFEDFTRAIRTKKYKYIKNFYPDLPNTPSADIIRGLSWQSMLKEKSKGTLTKAQLWCFQKPRPKEELYDIVADPYELNNLAMQSNNREVLQDMRLRLNKMREKTNDVLPSERMPDDFYRDTGLPTKYRIRPRPSKAEYMKARKEHRVLMNPDSLNKNSLNKK